MTEETKSKYKATIGLEIHAELKTQTKMFCLCKNNPDEEKPNSNICEICTAQPGTLPVLNKKAIEHVLKVGLACGSKIADFTEWDRKNYFYPDIPKGYQITQFKYPLVQSGFIKGVELTRIHLEEDTGSSTHDAGDFSLVNFNRAGVPLMELVTEPVIHSGKQAAEFAKELQLLLQYMGAGDANMEKGEMRVEANISVSETDTLGTKVEIKNLNSFRTVERAVAYEIERQIDAIEKGEKVIQETRGWDESKQKTFSQRLKESSHDYRYFPDPDLPKMMISEVFDLKKLKEELPELPWERREKLKRIYELSDTEVDIYVNQLSYGKYFEAVIESFLTDKKLVKLSSNYITSDLIGYVKKDKDNNGVEILNLSKIKPVMFAKLINMIGENKISSRVAKDILKIMYEKGGDPEEVANKEGLIQKNDEGALKDIALKLIAENPKVVADYKAGKEIALMFFVGQVMKATKGSSNPQVIKNVLVSLLS
jgi:aspartyl-tRNA(Asn)/glutamyl-tRNA(Gln) amidotransferase subunit B